MSKKNKPEVFDTETFIAKSKRFHGDDKFDYSAVNYIRAKVKVKLRCIKHDLWFETTPDAHNRAERRSQRQFGGCPECRREILGQYHRLSVEDFVNKALLVHGNKYDYSKVTQFKNCHTKIVIICPIHKEFIQTVDAHINGGCGCPKCGAINGGINGRLSQEEIIDRFKEQHGDKYNYSEVIYDGVYSPVKIYCKQHNHWFLQKPNDHFSGTGCRFCIDKGYSRNKSGYIYINKVGDTGAIKVGITNICPIERAKVLTRKSKVHFIENMFHFYHENGDLIYNLESEILSKFPTSVVPREEMVSGYTETISGEHLPEILDIILDKLTN